MSRVTITRDTFLEDSQGRRFSDVVKDPDTGDIVELHCTYDPATRGGDSPDGRKVKATLHWVSADHAIEAEMRLYDNLFNESDPLNTAEGEDWHSGINPNSLSIIPDAKLEPNVAGLEPGARVQLERQGYFCIDPDSNESKMVFNRTVSLKDTWAR